MKLVLGSSHPNSMSFLVFGSAAKMSALVVNAQNRSASEQRMVNAQAYAGQSLARNLASAHATVHVIEAHRRDGFERLFYFFACFVFESKVLACLRSG
jgi:hypothetical protein